MRSEHITRRSWKHLGRLVALHSDERGQMAFMAVLMLLAVFMFFALAFDAGLWYFDHRWAQNQAEMAAHAAALHLPSPDTTAATAAANAWLVYNRSVPASDQTCPRSAAGAGLQFLGPDAKGRYTAARVCIRRQSPGIFSSLFGISFAWVSAVATANIFEEPSLYSLMAMNPTACKSLYVHGPNVTIGNGGATYTRSSCCPNALFVQGTSSSLVAGQNDLAGGCGGTNGGATLEEAPTPYGWLDDPYAGLAQPIPSGQCYTGRYNLTNGTFTLSPGRYCDTLKVSSSAQVKLRPGIYIFHKGLDVSGSGSFTSDINGNGVLDPGEEVLLFGTCPTSPCNGAIPGNFEFSGSVNTKLKGLSTQENMLIWMDRTAGLGSHVRFRGTTASGLDGRIYAYKSLVDIGGDPGVNMTINMNIVADQIEFQGSATFTLDYDPILAPPVIVIGLIE